MHVAKAYALRGIEAAEYSSATNLGCSNLREKQNRASSANSVYQKHEREKRRGYEQRVREIENGCFSPLVFNTLGGMGPTAQVVYKRLADLIADKLHKPYSTIIRLVRCRLCFSLLRSTITCLRGSRRPKTNFSSLFTTDPALVVAEGRVPH